MKKVAIIVEGPFDNPHGQETAELNRIKYLKDIADYQTDVFSYTIYDQWLVRLFTRTKRVDRPAVKHFHGFEMRCLWRPQSFIDRILKLFKLGPVVNRLWMNRYSRLFKDYDLITAHSDKCGELALKVHRKYGIPYCVTWHGSDIHTKPYRSKYAFNLTKRMLDGSAVSFMVSRKLSEMAGRISSAPNKVVLYNGITPAFHEYDAVTRQALREKYGAAGKKVVAFAGNLYAVKDPMSLPDIFKHVFLNYRNVAFWVMGSGKFFEPLKRKCEEYALPVVFWGDVPAEEMPDRFNCVDVLVLPSVNEGLPLVLVEALACGANAVGSRVGGIPEVIGEENSFDRTDPSFAQNIADRVVQMLTVKVRQEVDARFSWTESARTENAIYRSLLQGPGPMRAFPEMNQQ